MTIEQLAQSGLEILRKPKQAGREQAHFPTTNPGFYLRTRAEYGNRPTDFILSPDELEENGLEGMIAKERRCWFRQATRLLQPAGGTGPTDPPQVRLLRDAWARHQRLLEGPPITSKEQVDFPALLSIKHFDPTSLAYALKVHHDISNVLGTEILPATEDLHDYLGKEFPNAAEVQSLKAVMCWDAPALFFAEDRPCDEKELAQVLARLGHASVGFEGSLGLPCGVVVDATHLRRNNYRHVDWETTGTCFACPTRDSTSPKCPSSPLRQRPQTDAILELALDQDDIEECKTLVRCARLHSSREVAQATRTSSSDIVYISD